MAKEKKERVKKPKKNEAASAAIEGESPAAHDSERSAAQDVAPVPAEAAGDVEVDLGSQVIRLNRFPYTGVVKVSAAVAEQLISLRRDHGKEKKA